jgi:nicotinate-nucleotide pyrophosphorylase (carboxylating)
MSRRDDVHPPLLAIRQVVAACLAEDLLPLGDLTANLLDADATVEATIGARDAGVLAGVRSAREVFAQIDPDIVCDFLLDDGDRVEKGSVIAHIHGRLASVVTAERSALNLLCHLSGVATLTRRYVDAIKAANPASTLWDTRKTTPGLRSLEKAAVRAGGGANHRGNLSEAVLIKDNHLQGIGIAQAVSLARDRWPSRMIEVECDRIDQVEEAVHAGATVVMCDNMSPAEVARSVEIARARGDGPRRCLVEASGRMSLERVGEYARAGADLISVGAITHSAPILDLGLDLP